MELADHRVPTGITGGNAFGKNCGQAIEAGFFRREIADAAFTYQREVDSKRKGAEAFKIKDCIIHDVLEEIPGLDLIPSHLKLTFLDLDLAARPGRERIFTRKLEKVKPEYDFIICDCAPNLMTGTQNALYASDWYFIKENGVSCCA